MSRNSQLIGSAIDPQTPAQSKPITLAELRPLNHFSFGKKNSGMIEM